MSKRETYITDVKCGQCGALGKATFTENENPVFSKGKLDRVTESAGEGFLLDTSVPNRLVCANCGSNNVDQS